MLGFDVVESAPRGDTNLTRKNESATNNNNNVSLQDALLQQSDRPAQQPVVITQGEPEEPALSNQSGEVCPAPALAKKSEEDDEND